MSGEFKKTVSMLALLAAAGIMVGGVAPKAAGAADLGGDCCADLEERIAELEATAVKKGNKKVSVTITGRANMNVMWWAENGVAASNATYDHTSDIYFGNVARNETEFNIKGEGKVNSDVTVGFLMEIYVDPSATGGTKNSQTKHQDAVNAVPQTTYVFINSKAVGELRLGNQYQAMHETFNADTGKDTIGRYGQTRGAFTFLLRDTANTLTSIEYSKVLRPLEDARAQSLMYISPTMAGLTLRADVAGDDVYGASLTYDNKFKDDTIAVKASLGYEKLSRVDIASALGTGLVASTDSQEILAVSGSISESTSGLYVTGLWGKATASIAGRQDATNWWVKGGWQKNVTGIGNTMIYAGYLKEDGLYQNATSKSSSTLIEVGIDQGIDDVGSVYLQYQRGSLDNTLTGVGSGNGTINAQSLDQVIGGMIVKF